MDRFDWLAERAIAHRGLHDASAGVVENTPSAFLAAIDAGYAIECDLQLSGDGEAMVHHDATLGRVTEGSGTLSQMTAATLAQVRFRATADRMLTLRQLCELVAGRVPLFLELKSEFNGNTQLVQPVREALRLYPGPAAVMSFDPEQVQALQVLSPTRPYGIVAEWSYADEEWSWMNTPQRWGMAYLLHALRTRPDFIAYDVHGLPNMATRIARKMFQRPVLAWTVRSRSDRERAERYASQIIFEGIRP
jgi:glycerophosphoryl diester phosphodiesterase